MKNTIKAFKVGHEVIWKHGQWRRLRLPIALSVLLVPLSIAGFFGLGWELSDYLQHLLFPNQTWTEWIGFVIWIALSILVAGPLYIVFRSLVLLVFTPFLDLVAEETESIMTGKSIPTGRTILSSIHRLILMLLVIVLASLLVVVAGFVLSVIPVAGPALSTAVVFFFQMFLSSAAFIDPYLDRRGMTPKQALALLWSKKLEVFFFGAAGFLITMIPVVGWFIGPTYSVISGVALGVLLFDEPRDEATQQLAS
ncbi:MAG: EI24 domain-containing protein [Candidatus Electrothrix aestuarii]|uniref:EI24 domain-containing protein n=1 Tax=Candidatus Electrothrix aestuarii TaxID=3062594 RepID=A0AAU8M148_9BACT|nr:EI24 domain-containing protein [Candidatus Electrothrix aestuarii]